MSISELLNNPKTHWQWYKNLFHITVLRYLVTWFAIVPIIINLFIKPIIKIKIGDALEISISENASLPFNLEILWFSSLFFVLALLIYQICCPGFIKTYSSFGDYKYRQHSPRWIIWESLKIINDKNEVDKFFNRLYEKKYIIESDEIHAKNEVMVESKKTVAYFKYKDQNYCLGLPILKNDGVNIDSKKTNIVESEIFWEIFGRFSSSRRFFRFMIILFLVTSAILFAYTLIQHIWSGLDYFYHNTF